MVLFEDYFDDYFVYDLVYDLVYDFVYDWDWVVVLDLIGPFLMLRLICLFNICEI